MKCLSCDKILSDEEATAKSERTGEYLELCNECLDPLSEIVDYHNQNLEPFPNLIVIVYESSKRPDQETEEIVYYPLHTEE